jgi:hypothetical protein
MNAWVLAFLRDPPPGSKTRAARDFGVDLTMMVRNAFLLTPAERLERAQSGSAIDVRGALDALDAEGVRYVVVGGAALGLQGSAYRTDELAVVYARDEANIERLVSALRRGNARIRGAAGPDGQALEVAASSIPSDGHLAFHTDFGDLAIAALLDGLGDYENVASFADKLDLRDDGRPTAVLSIVGLIVSMRVANRTIDRLALPEIEALRELQGLDRYS